MQPREGELHLRLHARDPDDPVPRGPLGNVLQQRRLSDPRLATDDENTALTLARLCQEAVEGFALGGSVQKAGRKGGGHLAETLPRGEAPRLATQAGHLADARTSRARDPRCM